MCETGVESTIRHSAMPRAQREIAGITEEVIRLSVGIEAIQDLPDDLAQALDHVRL